MATNNNTFFVHVSSLSNDVFDNVKPNDVVMYNTDSNQTLFIGGSNTPNYISIGSNHTLINNSLTVNSTMSVRGLSIENQGISISSDNSILNGAIDMIDDTVNIRKKLHVVGNITHTGTIQQTSDMRLKSDLTEITDATTTLIKMRPLTYLKTHESGEPFKEAGFIAQHIKEDVRELDYIVSSGGDYLSVNYNGLFAYIVQSIKEINTRLTLLENVKK
jgi:hypothetical protein